MVFIAAGGMVEAQEVELDAKELRDQFAEAVEQHLWRHVVGGQQGREAIRFPRGQGEDCLLYTSRCV